MQCKHADGKLQGNLLGMLWAGPCRRALMRAQSAPPLPLPPFARCPPAHTGLTKMVSRLSKEGAWRKALEVFEAVGEMG